MEKNVLSEKLYQDLVDTARTYGIETALGPVLQAIPERFLEEAQVTWRARLPATTPYDAFIEAVAQLAASQRRDLLHLVNICSGGPQACCYLCNDFTRRPTCSRSSS